MKSLPWLVFLSLVCVSKCSRILMVFPAPLTNHNILGNALAKGLVAAGHNVTMITPFQNKIPPSKQYREIAIREVWKIFEDSNFDFLPLERTTPFSSLPILNSFSNLITQAAFMNVEFQKLLTSNDHFDVVILEQSSIVLDELAHHFKAPLIVFSTIGANSWINPLVGNPAPPSYISHISLGYPSNMTFWQRLVNWVSNSWGEIYRHLFLLPTQDELLKKYFPTPLDSSTLNYNVSLVLLNSHETINQAVPYVPNMINIGGFHVNPIKTLRKDFQDFMDKTKEGVVYFSMGSNFKPSQIANETVENILKALGEIKQKVLWKWDEDSIPGQPSNVILSKWFPQQDILGHPNTKLFITHGGLLSTIEAIYHGVPVLTFPLFGDQEMNAAQAEVNGYGICVPFLKITEDSVSDALDKLLNDPKFGDNAKIRSALMRDRPSKPLDLAIFWIEYIIRHRGAPHLRVAGIDLPWYQYLSLDVVSFLILVSLVTLFIIYIILKKCLCKSRKKRDEKLKYF